MVTENLSSVTDASKPIRNHRRQWQINLITWLLRIIIGGVFIFSGFVKGIDPWGTIYKFNDYLAAMSIDIWRNLIIVGAFAICAFEFLCGIFILLGCFRRSVPIAAALFMLIMLPLTLWIALVDPVTDCGCFGDAYVISNWATFWKNVIISCGIIWLIIFNKKCHWLITPALQWLAFVSSAAFIIIIELLGFVSQPLLDFRPYKIGTEFVDTETLSTHNPEYVFVYEKDGQQKEFGIDDELPAEDDGWVFIDRKSMSGTSPVINSHERNLRVWDITGNEDVTEEVFQEKGKSLVVMMPDLNKVSPATTWKLNSLNEWSVENDVKMIAVVSGSREEIEEWEDLSMASYSIYTADDTQIKSVVRGNPGVIYVEDNVIKWKSTLKAINIDDFLSPETSRDASEFGLDSTQLLHNLSCLYLTIMAVLIVMSFITYLKNVYRPSKDTPREIIHDDMAHGEE